MALTEDQQNRIEFIEAEQNALFKNTSEASIKHARIEMLKMAKETLIENARNKPVSDREISSDDIVAFATSLENYLK